MPDPTGPIIAQSFPLLIRRDIFFKVELVASLLHDALSFASSIEYSPLKESRGVAGSTIEHI